MIEGLVLRNISIGSVPYSPIKVTKIEMIKLARMDWAKNKDAFFSFFWPRAFDINAVTPIDKPVVKPIIIK